MLLPQLIHSDRWTQPVLPCKGPKGFSAFSPSFPLQPSFKLQPSLLCFLNLKFIAAASQTLPVPSTPPPANPCRSFSMPLSNPIPHLPDSVTLFIYPAGNNSKTISCCWQLFGSHATWFGLPPELGLIINKMIIFHSH